MAYSHMKQGNSFLELKQYENAKGEYSKALILISHVFKNKGAELRVVKEIQIPCLINLSDCHLNLRNNYEKVIIHCNDVLKIDPNNLKAYHLRALAYTELGDFELDARGLVLELDDSSLGETRVKLNNKKKCFLSPGNNKIKFSLWTLIGKLFLINCKRRN
jgi:tetratricopeptide (TPR) repeat protein